MVKTVVWRCCESLLNIVHREWPKLIARIREWLRVPWFLSGWRRGTNGCGKVVPGSGAPSRSQRFAGSHSDRRRRHLNCAPPEVTVRHYCHSAGMKVRKYWGTWLGGTMRLVHGQLIIISRYSFCCCELHPKITSSFQALRRGSAIYGVQSIYVSALRAWWHRIQP